MEAAATRSGGFGGGVEWAGGRWQPDWRSMVAARSVSALESLVEHSLWLVVKIGAQPLLVGAWLAIKEVGLGCLWIGDEGGVESIFA
nr:hypothetical protein CFP56_43031 [Quercus suber]